MKDNFEKKEKIEFSNSNLKETLEEVSVNINWRGLIDSLIGQNNDTARRIVEIS